MRYDTSLVDGHILVSLDPGKRICGVAVWDQGKLIKAAAVECKSGRPGDMAAAVERWVGSHALPVLYVVETPKKYARMRAMHEGVQSLVDVLAAISTRIGPRLRGHYTPFMWKGNVPKEVHHRRLAGALHPLELMGAQDWDHNAWDAVGIGLYALGRTDRGGKLPKRVA